MTLTASAAKASQPILDVPPRPLCQRGAYALIEDRDGRVLVVQAANGRCYLPGGRIEPGESEADTLAREIAEECGWSAEIMAPIEQREQPIFGGSVSLTACYWRARLKRPLGLAGEHLVLWLRPQEAARRLHRPGDRALFRAKG
jgi:8-oxo-dGTP pyrophosphatase MutT (NUDIX family)